MKNSFHLWSQAESFFLLFNEEVFFSGNCLCVLWKFTIIISVHRMDSFPKGHKVGKPMYPSAIICTTFDCLQSIFTTICHRTQFILSKSFSRNSALLENMSTSVPSKLKPLNCGSHQKMITVVLGYFFNHSSFWECIFHLHCWIFSICVCVCVRCHSSWSLRCMFFTISKSEREKQISFSNTCIWNLERWYWWAYVQGRNRDTDIENRLVDTGGEGEVGTNSESGVDIYTVVVAVKLLSCVRLFLWLWTVAPWLLCPMDLLGENIGVNRHFLTQGSSWPRNRNWQADSLWLSHQGSPACVSTRCKIAS